MYSQQPKSTTLQISIPQMTWDSLNVNTIKPIGNGTYSNVYRGIWLNTEVAVKQLQLNSVPEYLEKDFDNETKIMAQCQHPNIVHIYGICTEPGHFSIVMEYMPKGSLFDVLQNKNIELSWKQRYSIAIDIGKGLSFLHTQNVLHRDLKSPNILLDEYYRAKITDFGLALSSLVTDSVSIKSNKALGTVRWMAPELLSTDEKIVSASKPSDVYSFGVILWEISAREIPYKETRNGMVAGFWIVKGKKEKIPDDCPVSYAAIIQKTWCMPEKRLTACEIVAELEKSKSQSIVAKHNVTVYSKGLFFKPQKTESKLTSPVITTIINTTTTTTTTITPTTVTRAKL